MKTIFAMVTALCTISAGAQVRVPEPEFKNSYVHLTTDSTFKKLPKETAQFKKHESRGSKWAKIAGSAASVAGSVGAGVALGSAHAGSINGVVGGIQAMNAASGVASAAGTLDLLTGFEGMDLVFEGKESVYAVPSGQDVRIVYRAESNDTDPMDFLRVVQLKPNKKERRIQWKNYSSSLLGREEQRKGGYLNFDAAKYGETSYLITIPAETLEAGEYAIVSPALVDATVLPVATFSVQK